MQLENLLKHVASSVFQRGPHRQSVTLVAPLVHLLTNIISFCLLLTQYKLDLGYFFYLPESLIMTNAGLHKIKPVYTRPAKPEIDPTLVDTLASEFAEFKAQSAKSGAG